MSADKDDLENIAALREQGDLVDYIKSLPGRPPKQRTGPPEPDKPCYHIRRPGAWPCGTAATGPTPPPCSECQTSTDPTE